LVRSGRRRRSRQMADFEGRKGEGGKGVKWRGGSGDSVSERRQRSVLDERESFGTKREVDLSSQPQRSQQRKWSISRNLTNNQYKWDKTGQHTPYIHPSKPRTNHEQH
jgi:hypothetical protein